MSATIFSILLLGVSAQIGPPPSNEPGSTPPPPPPAVVTSSLNTRHYGFQPATAWVYDANCPNDRPPFGFGKWIQVCTS